MSKLSQLSAAVDTDDTGRPATTERLVLEASAQPQVFPRVEVDGEYLEPVLSVPEIRLVDVRMIDQVKRSALGDGFDRMDNDEKAAKCSAIPQGHPEHTMAVLQMEYYLPTFKIGHRNVNANGEPIAGNEIIDGNEVEVPANETVWDDLARWYAARIKKLDTETMPADRARVDQLKSRLGYQKWIDVPAFGNGTGQRSPVQREVWHLAAGENNGEKLAKGEIVRAIELRTDDEFRDFYTAALDTLSLVQEDQASADENTRRYAERHGEVVTGNRVWTSPQGVRFRQPHRVECTAVTLVINGEVQPVPLRPQRAEVESPKPDGSNPFGR